MIDITKYEECTIVRLYCDGANDRSETHVAATATAEGIPFFEGDPEDGTTEVEAAARLQGWFAARIRPGYTVTPVHLCPACFEFYKREAK